MDLVTTRESMAVDVVVVGAGPAGLYAATRVHQAGFSVAVLEGRDRVGGRLLSVASDEGRLDLGATWFWANEPRINALIVQHNLAAFEQHLDGHALFQNAQGVQRMDGNQIDSPSGRLVEGTQSVAKALAAQLPSSVVRLNHVVESIVDAPEGLIIASGSGSLQAQHVIIAVPPATAVSRIDFGGQLSDRMHSLAAATPVWMGNIVKVVAQYRHAFWRRAGLAGSAFSYVGPIRELHDMSGPEGCPAALFGFAQPGVGNAAPTGEQVVAQLIALFGSEASAPLHVHIQDWRDEPLTSPDNVDELTNFQTYGHPLFAEPVLGGRCHWASTETATTAPGHIEGALQAAGRAADAVVAALRSPVSEFDA